MIANRYIGVEMEERGSGCLNRRRVEPKTARLSTLFSLFRSHLSPPQFLGFPLRWSPTSRTVCRSRFREGAAAAATHPTGASPNPRPLTEHRKHRLYCSLICWFLINHLRWWSSWNRGERRVKRLRLSKALIISEGTTVSEACRRLAARRVDAVLLTDANEFLSGIVTAKVVSFLLTWLRYLVSWGWLAAFFFWCYFPDRM